MCDVSGPPSHPQPDRAGPPPLCSLAHLTLAPHSSHSSLFKLEADHVVPLLRLLMALCCVPRVSVWPPWPAFPSLSQYLSPGSQPQPPWPSCASSTPNQLLPWDLGLAVPSGWHSAPQSSHDQFLSAIPSLGSVAF